MNQFELFMERENRVAAWARAEHMEQSTALEELWEMSNEVKGENTIALSVKGRIAFNLRLLADYLQELAGQMELQTCN